MKITPFLALATIAIALTSVGCSASGRVSVSNAPATLKSTDAQVAYVTKPAPTRR